MAIDSEALLAGVKSRTRRFKKTNLNDHNDSELLMTQHQLLRGRTTTITLVKVRAHTGDPLNEDADSSAKLGTCVAREILPFEHPKKVIFTAGNALNVWC